MSKSEWTPIIDLTGLQELYLLKRNHPSVRDCHDEIVGIMDGDLFLIRP